MIILEIREWILTVVNGKFSSFESSHRIFTKRCRVILLQNHTVIRYPIHVRCWDFRVAMETDVVPSLLFVIREKCLKFSENKSATDRLVEVCSTTKNLKINILNNTKNN